MCSGGVIFIEMCSGGVIFIEMCSGGVIFIETEEVMSVEVQMGSCPLRFRWGHVHLDMKCLNAFLGFLAC